MARPSRRALQPREIRLTDTDWLYRVAGLGVAQAAHSLSQAVRDAVFGWMRSDTKYAKLLLKSVAEDGWLSRPRSVGIMMSWLVGLLLLVVVWI